MDDGTAHIARVFNGYGEVERQTLTVNGIAIGDIALTRDNVGRITAKTETIGAETFAYAYAYDAFGRLTEVQLNGAVVEAYTYGPQGERLTETNTRRGISNRNYTYDAEDHLLTAGTASYVYNPDGYLTSKTDANGTTSYAYASRGELKRVELPSGDVVEYRHDPLGRRVAKYLNGELIEKYLWLGRTRLLATYAPDGSLKSRFNYADDRMPVSMTADGQTYYLAYDQVGSLRAVTDANGAVVKTVSYDSFGNVLEDSNPALDVPFGFAGGLYDADTGLVRFGYRDYDAEVGRWTAKDPIGFDGGDSDLYGYAFDDPILYFDSDGFAPLILPPDPSGLPGCWKPDLSHELPRYYNEDAEPDSPRLEFHKGTPGKPKFRGKDHWHRSILDEKGRWRTDESVGKRGHLLPGDTVDVAPCNPEQEPDTEQGPDIDIPDPDPNIVGPVIFSIFFYYLIFN